VDSLYRQKFATVLTRTPNENSVLILEAPEKRESESLGPIFRTGGRNLEGCVREAEISLQTESAADWAGGTRKALKTREKLSRNEKRPAVDLSTPGVKSFGRQSSNFDESSPERTLFITILLLRFRISGAMPVTYRFRVLFGGRPPVVTLYEKS
jgi:hypothetical protein